MLLLSGHDIWYVINKPSKITLCIANKDDYSNCVIDLPIKRTGNLKMGTK
jgi:hypothetical protein